MFPGEEGMSAGGGAEDMASIRSKHWQNLLKCSGKKKKTIEHFVLMIEKIIWTLRDK